METKSRFAPNRLVIFILINLLITFIAPNYFQIFGGVLDHTISFVAGLLLLTLIDRNYLIQIFWLVVFLFYLLYQIIISNLQLAWLVIQPTPRMDPGIIAVPLSVTTDLEILVLASAITLTPGTLSIELGNDPEGRRMLYVHVLSVHNPDRFRADIKNGFERLILRVSQGVPT
jgi:multicomponent Na+:H+ antiporter subunit E